MNILALQMDNPGKRHSANCTGTLSFPIRSKALLFIVVNTVPVPTTDSTPPEVSTGTDYQLPVLTRKLHHQFPVPFSNTYDHSVLVLGGMLVYSVF